MTTRLANACKDDGRLLGSEESCIFGQSPTVELDEEGGEEEGKSEEGSWFDM